MSEPPTESISTTGSVYDTEQDGDHEIGGILMLLEDLMDSVRKGVDIDRLETAISLLQDTLDNGAHAGESHLGIYRQLIRALLVRYGVYGWIEDLDTCWGHFKGGVGVKHVREFLMCQDDDETRNSIEVHASQLVKACRSSIDVAVLNNVVCTATEALDSSNSSSYSGDKVALQTAKLRILLGKALVMRYLKDGEIIHLNQATQCLLQQGITCTGGALLASMSFKSLQHIEWLRFVECADGEALLRASDYVAKEAGADEEGRKLYQIGTAIIQNAVDETQLEEGIALLTASLYCCAEGHPRRDVVLVTLANAFMTHFNRVGNYEELQGAIGLYREALDLRRPPHPHRSASLNSLAVSLFTRFEHKGAFEDLEECVTLHRKALELLKPCHPDLSMSLYNLANALKIRFDHRESFEDLEESILLHRQALELRPPPHPLRSGTLSNLACSLLTCFEHKARIEDLGECIKLHREALDLHRAPDPLRSASLNNLGNSLRIHFEHKGAFNDLEEAIKLHREAVDLCRPPHPDCSMSLTNLATSLSTRFNHKATHEDLEECIRLHREALKLCRPRHPLRLASISNLASSLSTRFFHKGEFEDLEESIILQREALELRPPSHPDRSISLNNLACSLFARFDHKGTHEDLKECIRLHRESLALRRPPHTDRSTSLNNLANSLRFHFEHNGAFGDLEEAIELNRQALDLCQQPHPDRSRSLTSLATSLSIRFEHKGALEDIEESIILQREALDLHPPPHPYSPMLLSDLARCLTTRFEHQGAIEDLEESIKLNQTALELLQPTHPLCTMLLSNLASSLFIRFEKKEIFSDLENALQYCQEAAQYSTGHLLRRLHMSRNWAIYAQKHRPALVLDAYKCSMELLPQLASLDLTVQQRQDVLQHGRAIAGNAARSAIDAGQCELAITFLSTGRSVFWSQALQLRTPVSKLLVSHHSAIAEKFITISRQLENASYTQHVSASNPSMGKETSTGSSVYPNLYKLVNQRQEIIKKIQKIPGYEDFLLPRPFQSLHPAAKNGPIIFLNASVPGCDALIMHGTGQLEHIPLLDICLLELEALKILIHDSLRSEKRSVKASQDTVETLGKWLGRDMVLEDLVNSSEETFRLILESLWVKIVQPVVNILRIKKTDSPTRIWWCPTGPFVSLPIHAAGVYSTGNEPIDCLFQYAVSSYITAPQDLLHFPLQKTQSLKLTAVIEPEAANAKPLPFTLNELERIGAHVPHQYLVAHVGSNRTPNHIEDIISSIQQSSFVHFGCHGMQSLRDPLESCLLLSGGRLTMSRLMKECQVPEGALAYLSACETAKGDEIRPDESLNLVATMMFAGFRSVVGTLWSILDCDAPIVADVFYRHLFRNGEETPPDVTDAAYGLHLATKKLRDEGKPFSSWIPYVHYGI